MKLKGLLKRTICAGAVIAMAAAPAYAKVGDIVSTIYTTDILTQVNGADIASFSIEGQTLIAMEDLKDYGFTVDYNDSARTLYVNRGGEMKKNMPSILRGRVGDTAGYTYETDIKVVFNGRPVDAYAIYGRMAVIVEELGTAAYGMTCSYDNDKRLLSLNDTVKPSPQPEPSSSPEPAEESSPTPEPSAASGGSSAPDDRTSDSAPKPDAPESPAPVAEADSSDEALPSYAERLEEAYSQYDNIPDIRKTYLYKGDEYSVILFRSMSGDMTDLIKVNSDGSTDPLGDILINSGVDLSAARDFSVSVSGQSLICLDSKTGKYIQFDLIDMFLVPVYTNSQPNV